MNKMSLNFLCFGSYWRNLTSPLTHWHRGTAVQIDIVKYHPELQVVVGEIGADVVVLTMAVRITQSILTLARNLLHRRPLGIIPDWKSKAFQAVLWIFWNIIDLLLAVGAANVVFYKKFSKHSTHTRQSMNNISIECHWGCKTELNKENMIPEKELTDSRMETVQRKTCMEEACDHKMFSDMNFMVSQETLLPSCTSPFIVSMICVPSVDVESSLPSEESDFGECESEGDCSVLCEESSLSESEIGDEETEKDSSPEDTSMDSGMQESWTLKTKEEMDDSEEESDWSDEEESWDAEGDADYSGDDDLWASFCRNDDPYNPLSFAMPTRGPKQLKKEVLVTSPEKHQDNVNNAPSIAEHEECQAVKSLAKKPVLSSSKFSHKCAKQKTESLEEIKQTGNPVVKKVRFSSNVVVHRMVTWSYAYRKARKGPWEECARDRSRFKKRIAETEAAIGFCLQPHHREKIWATTYCTENKS
ncbi:protein phosphatase 1 regulatory subunit 15A [Mantella aurantiaca]